MECEEVDDNVPADVASNPRVVEPEAQKESQNEPQNVTQNETQQSQQQFQQNSFCGSQQQTPFNTSQFQQTYSSQQQTFSNQQQTFPFQQTQFQSFPYQQNHFQPYLFQNNFTNAYYPNQPQQFQRSQSFQSQPYQTQSQTQSQFQSYQPFQSQTQSFQPTQTQTQTQTQSQFQSYQPFQSQTQSQFQSFQPIQTQQQYTPANQVSISFNNSSNAPGRSFSSYSYSTSITLGKGDPVVVERSLQTTAVNGAVQRTETFRDNTSKTEQIEVFRSFDDKEKSIEKKRVNGGNIETTEYVNGTDSTSFESEWRSHVGQQQPLPCVQISYR